MLRLPTIPQALNVSGPLVRYLVSVTSALQRWAALVHEKEQDIEVGEKALLILTDSNGKRWAVTVSVAGALVVTAL